MKTKHLLLVLVILLAVFAAAYYVTGAHKGAVLTPVSLTSSSTTASAPQKGISISSIHVGDKIGDLTVTSINQEPNGDASINFSGTTTVIGIDVGSVVGGQIALHRSDNPNLPRFMLNDDTHEETYLNTDKAVSDILPNQQKYSIVITNYSLDYLKDQSLFPADGAKILSFKKSGS